jgi:hypothetical protein
MEQLRVGRVSVTMARLVLGFTDGRDDIQIWRVTVNIPSKQFRTTDSEWFSSTEIE